MDTRARIREFLVKHTRVHDLGDDQDIFVSGLVNSLFALQLVMFLEREFEVAIEDHDLEIRNFHTISAMASMLARKSSSCTREGTQ